MFATIKLEILFYIFKPVKKNLHTAGLLVIQHQKLLLAFSKNKNCYYLPGGKVHEGESPEEALCREIQEELNVTLNKADLKYYCHISAPAYGEVDGTMMEQECFFALKEIKPVAAAEIGSLHYFSLPEYLLQKNTAPGAIMILQKLKAEGYIN